MVIEDFPWEFTCAFPFESWHLLGRSAFKKAQSSDKMHLGAADSSLFRDHAASPGDDRDSWKQGNLDKKAKRALWCRFKN
jgi:hypothetical protein